MWLFLLSVAFVVCLAIRYGLPYIGVWEKNIADTGAEGWDRWVESGGLGGERVWVKGAREGYRLVLGAWGPPMVLIDITLIASPLSQGCAYERYCVHLPPPHMELVGVEREAAWYYVDDGLTSYRLVVLAR